MHRESVPFVHVTGETQLLTGEQAAQVSAEPDGASTRKYPDWHAVHCVSSPFGHAPASAQLAIGGHSSGGADEAGTVVRRSAAAMTRDASEVGMSAPP